MSPAEEARDLLAKLGVAVGGGMESRSPIDGSVIGSVAEAGAADIAVACKEAQAAFLEWRSVPAPRRGELVRHDRFQCEGTATLPRGSNLSPGMPHEGPRV